MIVFAGVHFMAETAAILSPTKRVLLPDLKAGCSLAATVTAEDVRRWKAEFPDYIAVGYVNTTAEVKAELDYCCTSGNVLDVIDAIPADKGILFLPDFFLGAHVRRMRPDRRVEVWMGECHVHKGIRSETLNAAREQYPDAEVLVHPECGCAGQLIYEMGRGDIRPEGLHIASTEGMIRAVTERPVKQFIVATETGIMHRMRQMAPEKEFIAADPEAECAFMKTITLAERARLARARPLPHHRPARHRGARPRRHRPHGRAREVSDDAARIAAAALAEDGPTDVTTAVTVPLGLQARAASSIGAAACWPARPTPTPWHVPASAGSTGGRPTGARSGPAPWSECCTASSRASSGPSGRCSTCCSARRGSRPPPAPTSTPSPAPAAGFSTPGRPHRAFARSTSPRCWPAGASGTGRT